MRVCRGLAAPSPPMRSKEPVVVAGWWLWRHRRRPPFHQLGRLLGLRREPLVHLELRLLGVLGGALLGRRRALGLADGLEQLSVLWRESGVDGVERLLRLRRALLRDLQEGRWEEM